VEVVRNDDLLGIEDAGAEDAAVVGPECYLDGGRGIEDDDRQLRPRRVRELWPDVQRPPASSDEGSNDAHC